MHRRELRLMSRLGGHSRKGAPRRQLSEASATQVAAGGRKQRIREGPSFQFNSLWGQTKSSFHI